MANDIRAVMFLVVFQFFSFILLPLSVTLSFFSLSLSLKKCTVLYVDWVKSSASLGPDADGFRRMERVWRMNGRTFLHYLPSIGLRLQGGKRLKPVSKATRRHRSRDRIWLLILRSWRLRFKTITANKQQTTHKQRHVKASLRQTKCFKDSQTPFQYSTWFGRVQKCSELSKTTIWQARPELGMYTEPEHVSWVLNCFVCTRIPNCSILQGLMFSSLCDSSFLTSWLLWTVFSLWIKSDKHHLNPDKQSLVWDTYNSRCFAATKSMRCCPESFQKPLNMINKETETHYPQGKIASLIMAI